MNDRGGEKASAVSGTAGFEGGARAFRAVSRALSAIGVAVPVAVFAALGFAAFLACAAAERPEIHVSGRVLDADTGLPIPGAAVRDERSGAEIAVDGSGAYAYFARYEDRELVASAAGYRPAAETLRAGFFGRSPVALIDFVLEPAPRAP